MHAAHRQQRNGQVIDVMVDAEVRQYCSWRTQRCDVVARRPNPLSYLTLFTASNAMARL
jgi:hypothetical protein